jgi:general secretion pathway protein G
MKKAFTMIELIFVIVIIGILAAVAIPKMTATRDDAKISTIIANTKIIVEDVNTFYTGQGEAKYLLAAVTDITDVPLYIDPNCNTPVTSATIFAGKNLYICDDGADVLDITSTNAAGITQTLTLTQGASTSTIAAVLTTDKVFQALTNGTIGKQTVLGGAKVNR